MNENFKSVTYILRLFKTKMKVSVPFIMTFDKLCSKHFHFFRGCGSDYGEGDCDNNNDDINDNDTWVIFD